MANTSQGAKHTIFASLAGKTPGTYNGDLIAAAEAVSGQSGLTYAQALYLLGADVTGGTNLSPQGEANAAAIANGATNWGTWNDYTGTV